MQDVEDIADVSAEVPAITVGTDPVVKFHLPTFGEITWESIKLNDAVRELKRCIAEHDGITIWRNARAEMYIPAEAVATITWLANAYPVEQNASVIVPPKGTKFD